MGLIYKSNIQTIVDGFLLGIGIYDEAHISAAAKSMIEKYCANQRLMPLERRQIPPYFEIIDTEASPESVNDKLDMLTNTYAGKTKRELIDLCKQRGLEVPKKPNNADLVALLVDNDKNEILNKDNRFTFKSDEEFTDLAVQDQLQYLNEIFNLPDDIEENSNDEVEYMNALEEQIIIYGNLSLEEKVLSKIKDILHYINGGDGQ